jgi:hypothetical protein
MIQSVTLSQPQQPDYVESNNSLRDCGGGAGQRLEWERRVQIREWKVGPNLGVPHSRIKLRDARTAKMTVTAPARESGGQLSDIRVRGVR